MKLTKPSILELRSLSLVFGGPGQGGYTNDEADMKPLTRRLLLAQGFSEETICGCTGIGVLARWTPLACASLGLVGVILQSPQYMVALGAVTVIGALGRHSFYDYLYIFVVRPVVNLGEMPPHGYQRRFGCAIGAALYVLSGIGFMSGSSVLAYTSSAIIIGLAYVAAATHWCFASTLYNLLFSSPQSA